MNNFRWIQEPLSRDWSRGLKETAQAKQVFLHWYVLFHSETNMQLFNSSDTNNTNHVLPIYSTDKTKINYDSNFFLNLSSYFVFT